MATFDNIPNRILCSYSEVPVRVRRSGDNIKVGVEFFAEEYDIRGVHYFGVVDVQGKINIVSKHLGGYTGETLEDALKELCETLYSEHKFKVEKIVVEI
ncbi:MAG: hypothetical protein JHC26_09835 [Thermofilum sp.]|jgi:hypothetical protein|uniref:hypothetical protein n=1 Tax=Thermofilum sp. TaxID=1961369 RepID=UPI00258395C5|nr:hypothetical protein [Thermofilum sp.]MCI4409382.1 hypothetical protein [Thermofilum sp.]